MTIARDAGEDLIGRLGPDRRSRSLVGHGDVLEMASSSARAGMHEAADLLLRERGKAGLHEIDPRRARGREVLNAQRQKAYSVSRHVLPALGCREAGGHRSRNCIRFHTCPRWTRTPFERRLAKCLVLENCRVGDPDW